LHIYNKGKYISVVFEQYLGLETTNSFTTCAQKMREANYRNTFDFRPIILFCTFHVYVLFHTTTSFNNKAAHFTDVN